MCEKNGERKMQVIKTHQFIDNIDNAACNIRDEDMLINLSNEVDLI